MYRINNLVPIILGTGDAKHKVYLIFPYVVFKTGIIHLKESGEIDILCNNFVVDTYKTKR